MNVVGKDNMGADVIGRYILDSFPPKCGFCFATLVNGPGVFTGSGVMIRDIV